MNILHSTQPALSLSARIDLAQAAAARLKAEPGQHEPSPGLRARIAQMPEELQPIAEAAARRGYDAVDAIYQAAEEAQELGRLQAKLDRGDRLNEEESRRYVLGKANQARTRAGLAPVEDKPVSDFCDHGPGLTPEQESYIYRLAARLHAEQDEINRAKSAN